MLSFLNSLCNLLGRILLAMVLSVSNSFIVGSSACNFRGYVIYWGLNLVEDVYYICK